MKEIILFGRALDTQNASFNDVNRLAVAKGYVVHPDCCNTRVLKYLETLPNNYNSTFYKEWNDVLRRDRLELAYDQARHYASTYGTAHTGIPYIPNEDPAVIDFKDVKVIMPITRKEIQEK